ncbi:MFS transporter [Paracoccus sp. (in: a-proteobacteria)]|uniref:MFS transporter n=1 Tax=Paracoccus sp. TaxID=267 RepID=UPI003A8B850F
MTKQSLADPLRFPVFRRLWIGGILSNLGTMIQTVGAGWLMVTIAQSSDTVALVQSATTLPVVLFSMVAGVLADSYERKRVLLAAQVIMMAASAALAVTVLGGWITPGLLLFFTFLLGCGTALHTPSWQAAVGDVVPRDRIADAVTLNSMAINMTRSTGPAFGGVIVAAVGAVGAFLVNAVSYVPMIYALLRWQPEAKPVTLPREDFGRAVYSGLLYAFMSPHLVIVILRGFVFGISAIAVLALLPLVARDLVQGGAVIYGILLGAYGVGALAAGFANASIRARYRAETIVSAGFLGFAASMMVVAFSSNVWLTGIALIPAGACWVLALSLFNVVIQLSTPRWVVGRTLSIYQTASFGGMTAGAWLWGEIAERHDLSTAFVIASLVAILGAAVGLRLKMPDIDAGDLSPLNRFKVPSLSIDVTMRSGPVRAQIEYQVAEANAPHFVAAMTERRRSRLRNGARHWVLLRDLENPSVWQENYDFPTWAEYLRCNQRPTQADGDIAERIADLVTGQGTPSVRRLIERHHVPSVDDLAIKENPEVH